MDLLVAKDLIYGVNMSYIEDNLTESEQIVYKTKIHWAIFSGPVISCLLGILGVINRNVEFLFWLTIISPFWGLGVFLTRYTSEFGLTTQRVMIKVGIIHRRTLDIFLSKVESISVDQSVGGRMLGYGDLIIVGSGGTKEVFKTVNKAIEFRKKVQEQLIQAQKTQEKA